MGNFLENDFLTPPPPPINFVVFTWILNKVRLNLTYPVAAALDPLACLNHSARPRKCILAFPVRPLVYSMNLKKKTLFVIFSDV